jgi:hypothetical protein
MKIAPRAQPLDLIAGFKAGTVSRQEIEAHRGEIQAVFDKQPPDAFGKRQRVDDLLAAGPSAIGGASETSQRQAVAQTVQAYAGRPTPIGAVEAEAPKRAGPVELQSHADVMALTKRFNAVVLVLGHGSKGQIGDLPATLRTMDPVIASLDEQYGKGKWLAVFGGDPLKADSADIAQVMRYLQHDKGVPLLAIQSDKVKEWGGVDKHLDYVHYVPTDMVDGKIAWGGLVGGKPVGPTAEYLGADFTSGSNAPLKQVIAVGGGPITRDELQLAAKSGVGVAYVRTRAKNVDANGPYGAVDAWAMGQKGSGLTVYGEA